LLLPLRSAACFTRLRRRCLLDTRDCLRYCRYDTPLYVYAAMMILPLMLSLRHAIRYYALLLLPSHEAPLYAADAVYAADARYADTHAAFIFTLP